MTWLGVSYADGRGLRDMGLTVSKDITIAQMNNTQGMCRIKLNGSGRQSEVDEVGYLFRFIC